VIILSTARGLRSFQPSTSCSFIAALLLAAAPFAIAQTDPAGALFVQPVVTEAHLDLPDAPDAMSSSAVPATPAQDATTPAPATPNAVRFKHSAHFSMTVAPDEIEEPMTTHGKVIGGLKNSVSLFSATGWFASAGWEQLTNGSPNYGTDRGAFGQRLGAAAIRGVSEGILSNCLFAPVFHEDPRYYVMGRDHGFFKRVIYSGTRVLITRSDSGRTTPNFSLLAGDAGGAALTALYYPSLNTSFSEVAKTYGSSLGGSALGFVATEFIADALEFVHLRKQQ
jgi:hypothetical protein